MARLIVDSAGTERTLELEAGKAVSVGREPSNDVALPEERQASRRHCEFRFSGSGWEIVDLGATNKTRVNGTPTDRKVLSSGDVVEVGKVTLKFVDDQEDERLQQAGRQGVCLLEWADGPRKGQKVMLVGPRTTLGRRESNTVVLDDRMASGHHAEIVKDLNGYTIRDLGSTNGIMVAGNPTTEAPLSHGTRLRVGNSRFVFKDPSMKDVEVELSRLEEDDGWGMMGDIDLSRARGSKAGAFALLAVLALVGVGGWYIWNEGEKAGKGTVSGSVGEQIANGNFESEEMPWTFTEGTVAVSRTGSPGNRALQMTVDASATKPELVAYENEFSAADGRTLQVKAKLRGGGDLVAIWRNESDRAGGTTGVVRTVVVISGKGGASARTLGFPTWASALRLAVRVAPGERVTLDDLSVRTTAEVPAIGTCECAGLPKGTVEHDGSLTISINNTVLVVGGVPVAWKGNERLAFRADGPPAKIDLGAKVTGVFAAGETEHPGTIQWKSSDDGLTGTFECPGADKVGLAFDLPRAHLGNALNVLTVANAGSVPLTPGPVPGEVRKTLAGNPEAVTGRPATLIAIAPEGATASLVVEETGDASVVRLLHVFSGAKAEVEVITDFAQQKQAAQQALAAAKGLMAKTPGPAMRELRRVVNEYPFDAAVANEAGQLADKLEKNAKKNVEDLREAVQSFQILGSVAALADMQSKAKALREQFLAGGGEAPVEGTIEGDVAVLVKHADVLAGGHAVERALPDLDRFESVGRMLETTKGFEAMAALVYRSIGRNYASLASADPEVEARLAALAERGQALEQRPEVRDALPPR